MKKIFIISLVVALATLLGACSNSKEYVTVPPAPLKNQKTTVMVYIEGSNLESDDGAASLNIKQMMAARHSEYLNVVIQTGASDINYDNPSTVLPSNRTTNPPVKDWTRVKRYQVLENEIKELTDLGPGCSSTASITTNCVEMGSSETLRNFVQVAAEQFPADRYILVLWDHGGGSIAGYGGAPAKTMNVNDIKNALEGAAANQNIPFEIIGFDACLMANAEFAYNLKNNAKYFVASEELEPGYGWDYNTFLSSIAMNPKLTGAEIGKTIADSFFTFNRQDPMLTMSVTDLSKMDNLIKAIDSLAAKTLETFQDNKSASWIAFFNARNATDEFGAMAIEKIFVNDIDIADFAAALKYYGGEKYAEHTDMLMAAIENTVTYNIASAMHKDSKGISFWTPFHFRGDVAKSITTDLDSYVNLYGRGITKFSDTYITLLKEMLKYAAETPSSLTVTPKAPSAEQVEADIVSNFGIDDVLLLLDKSTTPGSIEPVLSTIAEVMTDGFQNFTASADYDQKILTLNNHPIYVESNGRVDISSPNTYILSIPLFFKESDVSETQMVMMLAQFNFITGEAQINPLLTPVGSVGKEDLEMEPGNVLVIPTMAVDMAGNVNITPSANEITITAQRERGLSLERTPYIGAKKYAFALTNLKGETAVSNFFGAATTSALLTEDTDKSKALAEALQKPLWTKQK